MASWQPFEWKIQRMANKIISRHTFVTTKFNNSPFRRVENTKQNEQTLFVRVCFFFFLLLSSGFVHRLLTYRIVDASVDWFVFKCKSQLQTNNAVIVCPEYANRMGLLPFGIGSYKCWSSFLFFFSSFIFRFFRRFFLFFLPVQFTINTCTKINSSLLAAVP